MSEIVKTMKLHIHVNETEAKSLEELTACYAQACTFISKYVFDHGFILNFMKLQETLYQTIRTEFGLKSQFTISAFKTVTARYKTVQEQMFQNPYRYENEKGKTHFISRTLEWLQKPIVFRRPQADLVRGRDYSFVTADDGKKQLSLNTLKKRIKVTFDLPNKFKEYFDGTWSFGSGKIVSMNGNWYFHIPMTKNVSEEFSMDHVWIYYRYASGCPVLRIQRQWCCQMGGFRFYPFPAYRAFKDHHYPVFCQIFYGS